MANDQNRDLNQNQDPSDESLLQASGFDAADGEEMEDDDEDDLDEDDLDDDGEDEDEDEAGTGTAAGAFGNEGLDSDSTDTQGGSAGNGEFTDPQALRRDATEEGGQSGSGGSYGS